MGEAVEQARLSLKSTCRSWDSLEVEAAAAPGFAAAEKEEVVASGGVGSGVGGGGDWFRHWRTGVEQSRSHEVTGDTCCVQLRKLALPLLIVSCTFSSLCTVTLSLPSLFLNSSNPFLSSSSSSDRSASLSLIWK